MFKMFTFKDRENYMLEHTDELDKFYRKHWDIKNIEYIYDKKRQIAGIDKILTLKDGTSINVDEKIESIKNTDNIVFEDKTDIDRNIDGWLKDGQLTDLIIDYQVEMHKVYVIPFKLMLQQMKEYREYWLNGDCSRIISNKTDRGYYRGRIFLINKSEVFNYLKEHSNIEWNNFEYDFNGNL